MAELQDAFVKLSNQNMELASELDTEKRRVAYLRTQLATPTPAWETTPIPVVDVESVSVQPSHVGSNPVKATPTSAQEATSALSTAVPPPATPTLAAQATPMDEAGCDVGDSDLARSDEEGAVGKAAKKEDMEVSMHE